MSSLPPLHALEAFATELGPQPDRILAEMEREAQDRSFPFVGRAVGGWCQALSELIGAERVVELGSGFGYSAYWFARAVGSDGTVVLTDRDPDRLRRARTYFERGGLIDRARFETGDAVEIVPAVDGPIDVALLDHEKARYVEGFEAVRPKIPRGGLVLADNAVAAGPMDFETVRALMAGESVPEADAASRGIATYLERVRSDPAFETVLLPLGEGLAVSARVG